MSLPRGRPHGKARIIRKQIGEVKDQEITSLREEVHLLVKEKINLGDAVKTSIDSIIFDHSNVIAELVKTTDEECAKKDEVIRIFYILKGDSESKIK